MCLGRGRGEGRGERGGGGGEGRGEEGGGRGEEERRAGINGYPYDRYNKKLALIHSLK